MNNQYPNIKKQNGDTEPFIPEKLRSSLRRSGADPTISDAIVAHVKKEVQENDTTSHIYKHAFSLLKKRKAHIPAARYSMKRAVQELGPSGFPFEDFVAEIFKARGYSTKTGVITNGKCANHEVDLIAEKDGVRIGAEMKFHNSLSLTSDLKVALYVDARFVDLKPKVVDEGWLITNTRFTKDAVEYGTCRGLTMMSWSYPEGGSLQDLIEETGIQPVTALVSPTNQEKKLLLEKGIILCKQLHTKPEVLKEVFSEKKLEKVVAEGLLLCKTPKGV